MDNTLRNAENFPEIILASGSPRRRELLRSLGWKFRVIVPEIDESIGKESPLQAVERLAMEKARAVSGLFHEDLVIAADTIVVIEGRILGKPENSSQAIEMLSMLNNRTHEVITGLAVCWGNSRSVSSEITKVSFRKMNTGDLSTYVSTGEGLDKAGAYAIQGRGSLLVKNISGCYFNVVGLPLFRLSKIMEDMGLSLSIQWREIP